MNRLEPCPFCGRTDCLSIDNYENNGKLWWFVACEECMCSGPVAGSEEQAVDAWNERKEDEE